jgi:GDPmannose 4,6-dehydratase
MSQKKIAIITGITGQDGSLFAEKLLAMDYTVYGLIRRNASEHLACAEPLKNLVNFEYGDLTDAWSLNRLCKLIKPHVFINCAAQSHVGLSFEQPLYTVEATGVGVLNCLEAIRQSGVHTRFLQLSSSEMFGNALQSDGLINESTPLVPLSPYASAKVLGYNITRNYRESYRMFAANSIAFNHECPGRRGPNFVTRKIAIGVANIKRGIAKTIRLGNTKARRDWGHASEYVDGMIKILNHSEPDDFIVATGKSYSVEDFIQLAFKYAGIEYNEKYIEIDQSLIRQNELNILRGDASKIKKELGWEPKIGFDQLVKEMIDYELSDIPKDHLVGHSTYGLYVIGKDHS